MSGARPLPNDNRTVAVVGGGDPLTSVERSTVAAAALVIAADSGVDRAAEAGIDVDVAVGDFDSVSESGLARAVSAGAQIERFSDAKDETDLELAMLSAIRFDPEEIVVVGLAGGRPDHALASLLLLADSRWSSRRLTGHVGSTSVTVIGSTGLTIDGPSIRHTVLRGSPGDTVSLIAIGGDAVGVTTTGLEYPLDDEVVRSASPRGVSNVFVDSVADIWLRAGTLFAFQPPLEEPK